MRDDFDVVVAGSGPAGSIAALVLAREGARVALVDPHEFPRDKACGDYLGPRGVRLLLDLGVSVPGAREVPADVVVRSPGGRELSLPWPSSVRLPPYVYSVPRTVLDAALRDAALEAGAEPVRAKVRDVVEGGRRAILSTGAEVAAGAVIGADGAMSRVGRSAGLMDGARPLWGVAVRSYVEAEPPAPLIAFNPPSSSPRGAPPGYGWIFPGPGGQANVGFGIAVGDRRGRATGFAAMFDPFVTSLKDAGWIPAGAEQRGRRGAWLRMGLTGAVPARDRVLLAGDAAGLINPLQGEGISEAMLSAHDAARVLLDGEPEPATRYSTILSRRHARFYGATGAIQRAFVRRPGALAAVATTLTSRPLGPLIARGWAVWWNDLLHDAGPGAARRSASAIQTLADGITVTDAERRGLHDTLVSGATGAR